MTSVLSLGSLGGPRSVQPQMQRWLEGLFALPGSTLVVEAGRDLRGPYFRAWGPGPLLALGESLPQLQVRSLPTVGEPRGPDPEASAFAPGRVVWAGPLPSVASKETIPMPDLGTTWGVQGLFHVPERGGFVAHVRLATGPAERPAAALDSVGLWWASALGGIFEPWRPGTLAARVAAEEWRQRVVRRFHSGAAPPPPLGRLAAPWVAPPAFPEPVAGGSWWRLGWPWKGPFAGLATDREMVRHVGLLGMTGSGKTQYLSHLAAEASFHGVPFALFDLHGDLGPSAVSRLDPHGRERVIVIDGARPCGAGRAGVDVLARGQDEVGEDLTIAEVLSALRPTGGREEEFWGPRLERILGSTLRAVWETGGSLADAAEVVHDPAGHAEVFAKGTSRVLLRRFLQDLIPLNRRQPDYLASSQNRLSLLVLSKTVAALLAPQGRSVRLREAIEQGRSLVFHLPKGAMGEGPSLFVANLLLSRLFLGMMQGAVHGPEKVRCLVLLDEMQNFSPPLVRDLLETGRKFGVGTVFATQSVERTEGAIGSSLMASVGSLLCLRTPQPSASRVVGLLLGPGRTMLEAREGLEGTLESLPDHTALVRAHGTPGLSLLVLPAPTPFDPHPWTDVCERSAQEFGNPGEENGSREDLVRQVLLAAVRTESSGPGPVGGSQASSEEWRETRERALSRGWLERSESGVLRVTEVGWAVLGMREESGAPRESQEHRRLIGAAFRLFSRNGVRLEIPVQGDLHRQLPDAVAHLLPVEASHRSSPGEVCARLESLRASWLWRLGRGRDVHVEAEVSSLRDPARLRRSIGKARRANAFLVFVTGTPHGGQVLRRLLAREGWGPDRATVWVLLPPPEERRGIPLSGAPLSATA